MANRKLEARELLIYYSIKYKGDWDKILESLRYKADVNEEELEQYLANMKCKAVTYLDAEYPSALKQIYKPPFVLYYQGDLSLLKDYTKNLAVIGGREPDLYSIKATEDLIREACKEYNIVSGLAVGTSTNALITTLNNEGKAIAVLGTGLDKYYPQSNKKLQDDIAQKGLVITEYPEGVEPDANNFIVRNRIIVGISKGVLAIACKEHSGTMAASNMACSFNRELMVIPYPIGSGYYNNQLINEGASMVENLDDIKNAMRNDY